MDGSGQPCLLLSDADAHDSSRWFPVRELLQLILEPRSSTAAAGSVKKVLILDSGRMGANWQMGVLDERFPASLAALVEKLGDPNLYVLNSHQAGQISWPAPELGGSVFGYFVAQALVGENDQDRQVTLRELHQEVERNVQAWTSAKRASSQQPLLITAADQPTDFPVVYAGRRSLAVPTEQSLRAYREGLLRQWEAIAQLWTRADQVHRRQDVLRLEPVRWADLERRLLRSEQLLLAGRAYQQELQAAIAGAEGSLALLDGQPTETPLVLSLPSTPVADEWERAAKAWRAHLEPKKEGEQPKGDAPRLPYAAAAAATWKWLVLRRP